MKELKKANIITGVKNILWYKTALGRCKFLSIVLFILSILFFLDVKFNRLEPTIIPLILVCVTFLITIAAWFHDSFFDFRVKYNTIVDYNQSVKVIRNEKYVTDIRANLKVGDIIYIEAPMICPADVKLTSAYDIEVLETAITGNKTPMPKTTKATKATTIASNIILADTNVIQGEGEAMVIAVGNGTISARILHKLRERNKK